MIQLAAVAEAARRRGVVDPKFLYHHGRLVVDGTIIVPGEEHP
jgi:hypothetical protein